MQTCRQRLDQKNPGVFLIYYETAGVECLKESTACLKGSAESWTAGRAGCSFRPRRALCRTTWHLCRKQRPRQLHCSNRCFSLRHQKLNSGSHFSFSLTCITSNRYLSPILSLVLLHSPTLSEWLATWRMTKIPLHEASSHPSNTHMHTQPLPDRLPW